MTLCDNPVWLLSHIRNSFTVSDDTGNSQVVLTGGEGGYASDQNTISRALGYEVAAIAKTDDDDGDEIRSPEIRHGGRPMLGYRARCNTEIKLEKMKHERKNSTRVKVVNWKNNAKREATEQELKEMFPTKAVINQLTSAGNSTLSKLMDETPQDLPKNPFISYSRCGCLPHDEKKKDLTVIIKGQHPEILRYKISVQPKLQVRDVVGHVCWLYTSDGNLPKLEDNVEKYGLYIADHDGAVEYEMPCLDNNEIIARYGFNVLALVNVDEVKAMNRGSSSPVTPSPHDEFVKIILPDGMETTFPFPQSPYVSVKDVIDDIVKIHKNSCCFHKERTVNYQMELKDQPGVPLDPATLFKNYKGQTAEFYVVREHSRRYSSGNSNKGDSSVIDMIPLDSSFDGLPKTEYRGLLLIKRKLKVKTEVSLIVTNSKIEIVHAKKHGGGKKVVDTVVGTTLLGNKDETFMFENVACCDVLRKEASPGFVRLRILLAGDGGKHRKIDLECKERQGREIESNVNHLLAWHSSKARNDFLSMQFLRSSQPR